MRSLLAAALTLALLGGCVTDRGIPDPDERLTTQTVLYIELMASGDRFEVESSQLALERSQNPAVRAFAATMIEAHTRMSGQLEAAAQTVRPATPAFALISHHFEMLEQLRHAGADFDMLYRDFQLRVHQEALALDQDYAKTGNVVALVSLAREGLGPLQAHLQQAMQLPVPPTPAVVPLPPPAPYAPRGSGRAGERG